MHQAEHLQRSLAALSIARQYGYHASDQCQNTSRAPSEDDEKGETCNRHRADQVKGSIHERCFLA